MSMFISTEFNFQEPPPGSFAVFWSQQKERCWFKEMLVLKSLLQVEAAPGSGFRLNVASK